MVPLLSFLLSPAAQVHTAQIQIVERPAVLWACQSFVCTLSDLPHWAIIGFPIKSIVNHHSPESLVGGQRPDKLLLINCKITSSKSLRTFHIFSYIVSNCFISAFLIKENILRSILVWYSTMSYLFFLGFKMVCLRNWPIALTLHLLKYCWLCPPSLAWKHIRRNSLMASINRRTDYIKQYAVAIWSPTAMFWLSLQLEDFWTVVLDALSNLCGKVTICQGVLRGPKDTKANQAVVVGFLTLFARRLQHNHINAGWRMKWRSSKW